jgi:hypothetical protein
VKEWLSAMRCLVCNAEMVLMEAVQADPTTRPVRRAQSAARTLKQTGATMTTATQCAGLATLLALTTASPSFAQTRTTMPNGYPSHYCLPTTVDSAEEQKVYCEGWRTFRQGW